MKKTLFLPVYLVCIGIVSNAQDAPAPPPPPPQPPTVETMSFSKDATTSDFFKRNPSVKGINRTNEKVILILKNNFQEKYDFSNAEEKKGFIEKYGELPDAPVPPPPPPAPGKDSKKKKVMFAPPTIVKDPV